MLIPPAPVAASGERWRYAARNIIAARASEELMKTTLSLAVLFLFVAAGGTCLAMISTRNVPKDQAKELGIELRGKPNGPNEAWIELEFMPEGKLADFKHVSLEIADDKQFQLGWTPLKDERTSTGSVIVRLMGNRAFLEKVTLRVVRGDFGDHGDDLRIKDFVNLKELR
jgi:hypothetical protein